MKTKYINIYIEEKNTGMKMGPMTSEELKEALCLRGSQVSSACTNGKYKNYKITAELNPEFKKNKKDKSLKKRPDEMQAKKPMDNAAKKPKSLLMCFEGLKVIENCYAEFGFADIATFIKWMYENNFVYEALKQ